MSIPAERLREGQQILIRGKVSFSRLAQLVEGEALVKSIESAQKRGQLYPTKVPHTTINLVDAQVIAANPAALTTEEQFVQEKTFIVKSGDNAGKVGYSLDNKSSYLPTVLEMDPENAGQYRQLVLERDLASGIEVTLVLQVFKPAGYEKRGIGLQQIVLSEPVRYFASSGVDASALAARGIVVNGPVRAVAGADSTAVAAPFQTGAEYAGSETVIPANSQADAHGFAVPTPGAQGAVPVQSFAAQTFPVSAPVAVATLAPVAVAPVAAPVAAPVETQEQIIARLTQQVAEQAAAQTGSGGGSPFDAAPAASAPAGAPGPWDVPGQAAAAYQG